MDSARSLIARALVAATVLLGGGSARANEPSASCARRRGVAAAPVRVPLDAADFGTLPEACPATELSLSGHGSLLVATRDFYGFAAGGASLRGRLELPGGSWVSLWVPGVEVRYVANATVDTTATSLGAGALGWHLTLPGTGSLSVAPFARVLLPTETLFRQARRYGVEHGVSVLVPLARRLDLSGGVVFSVLDTVDGSRSLLANAIGTSADVLWRPWGLLSFAAGAGLRPLDSFDARAGVRLFPWRSSFFAVDAIAPLVGRDRTDVAVSTSLGWTPE